MFFFMFFSCFSMLKLLLELGKTIENQFEKFDLPAEQASHIHFFLFLSLSRASVYSRRTARPHARLDHEQFPQDPHCPGGHHPSATKAEASNRITGEIYQKNNTTMGM